jgi:GT2 family glycosyltransferase
MIRALAVIIPSKTATNLGPCLKALRENEPKCEIIVVDDGIDFDLIRNNPEWTAAAEGIQIVPGKKPFIFARNCNIGIRAAGKADVVLLNDDALLKSPGGLSLMQAEAERDKLCGCVGAVTNLTGQILQKPRGIGFRQLHHIAFVCVLIPRRTINKIGLLDERYRLDYGVEDRDYCEMINRAGLYVAVHDKCYVDHGSLVSSYRGRPMAPGRSNQNRLLFLKKFNLGSYWKW